MDGIMDVYGGQAVCPCPTTTAGLITCGDDTCGIGGGPAEVTFNVTAGMCYTIRVAGWNASAGSGVVDLSYNTACDLTPPTPQPVLGPEKCRFISMTIPNATSNNVAIRVMLTSLHHVNPPYHGGPSIPFTAFEGQVRWVGPPQQYTESNSNPTTFYGAHLQCAPHYQAWDTLGVLHVTGSAVTPSSIYHVQTVAASCMGNEAGCAQVSAQLELRTTRWGDVQVPFNPPSTGVQPDFSDISAMVDKFRSAPNALTKSEALLHGDSFGVINIGPELDFVHISQAVNAFRATPYPFAIATCP